MNSRAARLVRLVGVRRIAEEIDRRDLEVAVAAVAEVDAAIQANARNLVDAEQAAREALNAGERGEWLLADAQVEAAGWNRRRLGELRAGRWAAVPPAREKFMESRREHEQGKVLVEDAREAERLDEERRAQAEADDWFLGKRAREKRAPGL